MPLNISVQSQKRCKPWYNDKRLHLEEYKYFIERSHRLRRLRFSSQHPCQSCSQSPWQEAHNSLELQQQRIWHPPLASPLKAHAHTCGPLPKLKIKIMKTFQNYSHARGPLTYEGHFGTSGGIWVGSRKQRWCNRSSWIPGRAGHGATLLTLLVNSNQNRKCTAQQPDLPSKWSGPGW